MPVSQWPQSGIRGAGGGEGDAGIAGGAGGGSGVTKHGRRT